MLSKLAGGSQREEKCNGECSHYNRPSRNLLQKEFATSVTVSNVEYFVCGNGPYILTGEYDLAPFTVTEITVFPQLQVTVRGIIPMSQEKCILAFGANYLAMVGFDQLKHGGHVCQSRIATTASLIVGGRRVGENKVQVFYENGGFETFEVAKKKGSYAIAKRGAKKLNLQGAKVTAMLVSGPNVLLGTSTGQVISHAGKIYFKGDESKGAVRQMTVINEHIVLLLFQNKALALLDLRYHALRSIIKGRFTAVESVFYREVIIVGDLDGTLHCFRISPNRTKIWLANSSKCIYRDAIISMFPIHTSSLVCNTAMGSQFVVNRAGFVDSTVKFHRGLDFGSHLARTSKDKCYFIKDKRLYSTEGSLSSRLHARLEYSDLEFTQLKHFRLNDFELVYAFGGGNFFSEVTQDNKSKRWLMKLDERITTAVAAEDYLLIQQGRGIKSGEWKPVAKTSSKNASKVSAFSKASTPNFLLLLIAFQDGRLYAGHLDSICISHPVALPLTKFPSSFPNDFAVAMQSFNRRIYILTAKAKLLIYLSNGIPSNGNPLYTDVLMLENSTKYKYPLGRGYDILVIDHRIFLVGFKQKMLNVYKLNEHQILSMETRGPRSTYSVHEASTSSMRVVYSLGVGAISRRFPKMGRILNAPMGNAGTITHVLWMFDFPDDGLNDVFADIVTGDSNGMVTLMGCETGFRGSRTFTRMTYQLKGAITAMSFNRRFLFVGTSAGELVVYAYTWATLLPVINRQYLHEISYINAGEGAVVGFANGQIAMFKYSNGRLESKGLSRLGEMLKDIKWCWIDADLLFGRMLSLSKNGILYISYGPETHRGYRRSIDLPMGQRYSYFKDIYMVDGVLTCLAAGYYDGRFLFAVYAEVLKKWAYFTADYIHRHEIIDCLFYKTPSTTGCIWSLATLDKAGLYVQRTLLYDSTGIKLHGLPMKWYCPLRNPKAMVFLETKKEVVVVGSGLATLYPKWLAPPPFVA